jgi:Predicted membrane protein
VLTTSIILIVFFYLIGSLPFALIVTKVSGFGDIRNIGSGNVGATNVLRTGNKFLALIVLCLDIFKGFVPFLILEFYFNDLSLINKILF